MVSGMGPHWATKSICTARNSGQASSISQRNILKLNVVWMHRSHAYPMSSSSFIMELLHPCPLVYDLHQCNPLYARIVLTFDIAVASSICLNIVLHPCVTQYIMINSKEYHTEHSQYTQSSGAAARYDGGAEATAFRPWDCHIRFSINFDIYDFFESTGTRAIYLSICCMIQKSKSVKNSQGHYKQFWNIWYKSTKVCLYAMRLTGNMHARVIVVYCLKAVCYK